MKQTKTLQLERYKLKDENGETVRMVVLEELNGEEELDAIERGGMSGARANEQMIAQMISHVNGEEVTRPYLRWTKWPSRTRDFIRRAAHRLNSASEKELADFERAVFGEDEG